LERLTLENLNLDEEAVAKIANIKSLRDLTVWNCRPTADAWGDLADLRQITRIMVAESSVPDVFFEVLARNHGVESLDLGNCQVSPASIRSISSMTGLKSLGIEHMQVAHDDLMLLGRLKDLKQLSLDQTKVSDAVAADVLPKLTELQTLKLSGSGVSGGAVRQLIDLASLQQLALGDTPVTDADVKLIAGMGSLQTLDLTNTRISEACIDDLAKMANLTSVDLTGTNIPEAGISRLQAALPAASISK
jgi:Leucine-rich repeat (LRR) protein